MPAWPYLLRLGDAETAAALISDIHDLSQTLDFRRDLQSWIHELRAQVEPGEAREDLLRSLADVYRREGRPGAAIPLYGRRWGAPRPGRIGTPAGSSATSWG